MDKRQDRMDALSKRRGSLFLAIPLFFVMVGCAALEPVNVDKDVDDQVLSVDTLKGEIRAQQRTIEALREEITVLKQELSEARIAQARMEGQVREVERRFSEARQIVRLQREELSRIRNEREEVLSSGKALRRQMESLQQQLAHHPATQKKKSHSGKPTKKPVVASKPIPQQPKHPNSSKGKEVSAPTSESRPERQGTQETNQQEAGVQSFVAVQAGDTLWSLARRYGVDLLELRALNELTSDHIFPGQALLLPLLLKSPER